MIARTSMREAISLGLEELSRTLGLLRSLDSQDWARPTDCTGWDVHDVVAHLVGQFEGAARPDRGIRAFGRIPAPLRRLRLSRVFPEAAELPDDSLDFLIRIIGPRDPWMHRIDICAATNRAFNPDGHDAKIVEQVVADLAAKWRDSSVRLALEGPAGGEWVVGQGVPVAEVRCDAIGYCRHVSGRPAPPAGVTGEREVGEALLAVKISF